jgi:hypothetical protein
MTDTTMTAEEAKYIADELALPDFSLSEIDRAKMRETLWRYADLIDQSNMHNLHNTPDDVREKVNPNFAHMNHAKDGMVSDE